MHTDHALLAYLALALLGLGGVAPVRADTTTHDPQPGYGFIIIKRDVPPQPVLRRQPPGEVHGAYAAPDIAALPALEELSDGEANAISARVTAATGAIGGVGNAMQPVEDAAARGGRGAAAGTLSQGLGQALGGVAGYGAGVGHSVGQATQGIGAAVTGITASLGQTP